MIPINRKKFIGPAFCVTAALIWGLSFVVQKTGAELGTFTFNGIRTFLGGIVMVPLLIIVHIAKNKKAGLEEKQKFDFRGMLKGGFACGTVLFAAGNLQQQAFLDLEAGKVAFITALYMIIVPIAGLFLGRRPRANVWAGLVLGICGLYLICVKKGISGIGKGETFALLCAAGFAVHILVVDKFCTKVDNLALSCGQYLVAGALSIICMFIFERPVNIHDILSCAPLILYAGIGSCSFAFTFQVFGQRYSEPAVASLLLCLESVFAVIFSWIILRDDLGTRALTGCAIMFTGVILTQLEFKKRNKGVKGND